MRYVYTKPMCSACDTLKHGYRSDSVTFQERSGDRLGNDPRIFDDIDREAFMVYQMQNQTFPVVVEIETHEWRKW
jgi:hypothetical protein